MTEPHTRVKKSPMFLLFENEYLRDRATHLADRLNITTFREGTQPAYNIGQTPSSFLVLTENRLELRQPNLGAGAFYVDFHDKDLLYRIRHSNRKNEALARAVGLKKNKIPVVFDLTAGIGRDAFVLARLGCTLHLFEREPIIAALLEDGLKRAGQSELIDTINRMTLHHGDALKLLEKVAKENPPDVLYLDPMFPHRTKSALVKKEMRFLQAIAGNDQDSAQLFVEAQKFAGERVVCKRPMQAPFLNNTPPSMSITTKKHRFDVYLTNRN